MRPDLAEAERRADVRGAARRWRGAGAIDDATRDAIVAAHPDDRRRLGPAFRALVFLFTFVAIHALFGIVMLVSRPRGETAGVIAFAYGLALCALAEALISLVRCREMGAESAAALAGLCYVLIGFGVLIDGATAPTWAVWLGAACLACTFAAWRWGYPLAAAVAAVFAFALLARAPGGRLLWLLAGPLAAAVGLWAGDRSRVAPAHRRGAQAVAVIGLLALYTALHLGSWDDGLVEIVGGRALGPAVREGPLRRLAIVATAVIPVLMLAAGVLLRRTILIRVGVLLGLASVATLRFYVHVMPLWLALILGGSVAIAAALAVRRYLHTGHGRERRGFTADPLFDPDTGRTVVELAAVAALSPAAAPRPAESPGLEAGGGRYGGGGASGTY
jgi:hypothetical protein